MSMMRPWRRRLDESGRRPVKAAIAITDGEHVFTVIALDGSRRVRGYPPDKLLPERNFRTSNVISYNLYEDAAARPWVQGYFEDGSIEDGENFWGPAWWQMDENTFVFLFTIDEQTGRYGHRPRPIQVVDDGGGTFPRGETIELTCGLYVVAQASEDDESGNGLPSDLNLAGAIILHWDGEAATLPDAATASDWPRRTATDDVFNNGSILTPAWGRGNTHSFHDGPDVVAYNPETDTTFQTFATEAAADASDAIGYGHYFYGWPMHLFYYSARWYAIMRGFIVDKGDETLDPESIDTYAACALFVLNEGEEPTNAAAWVRCLDVWAAFDVDNAYNDLGGADKVATNFYAWSIEFAGRLYFYANSIVPQGDVGDDALIVDDTAVRVLDGDGLHNSISFSESNSYGGPLLSDGVHLYWVEISVSEQKLLVWRLESSYDHWGLRFAIPLSIDEGDEFYRGFIASAEIANGRLYVVWGRRGSPLNDIAVTGDGDGRLWQMVTVRLSTGTATYLSSTMPIQDFYVGTDDGPLPRIIPVLPDQPDTGGGGGVPSGDCDDDFSPFGTSTITVETFGAVMAEYDSPLLDENPDPSYWYDLCTDKSINASFALGQMVKESQIGSVTGGLSGDFNVCNIRCHPTWHEDGIGFACTPPEFCNYASWSDGFIDYLNVCNLDIYSGKTVSEFITLFAPPEDGNNTQLYINQTCARLYAWQADEVPGP